MKILSTADNHLGFRQYGLIQRELDIEDSFRAILELGVKEKVDAITVSGDILHSVRPTSHTIQFLKNCQEYLKYNKLLCLVSIGNHDNSKPHWIRNLSESSIDYGFKVLNDETYVVENVSQKITVYGKTFCSREEFDTGNCLPKSVDMLLMHQSFNEITTFPNEKSFGVSDFENVTAKLVVVGDTHIHRKGLYTLDNGGEIEICSPGSSELMSESEEVEKFVFIHTFCEGELNTESVAIDTRKVVKFEVRTEEEAENALIVLEEVKKLKPLVFLKFDTDIKDILHRCRKQVDAGEVIIRPKPIMKNIDGSVDQESKQDLTFSDILKSLIPDKPSQFELVSQLLNPEADVNSLIDNYVETRLKYFDTTEEQS